MLLNGLLSTCSKCMDKFPCATVELPLPRCGGLTTTAELHGRVGMTTNYCCVILLNFEWLSHDIWCTCFRVYPAEVGEVPDASPIGGAICCRPNQISIRLVSRRWKHDKEKWLGDVGLWLATLKPGYWHGANNDVIERKDNNATLVKNWWWHCKIKCCHCTVAKVSCPLL